MDPRSLVFLCLVSVVLTIEINYEGNTRESKKLFGGYRITPRFCKPSRKIPDNNLKGPTICMFNHECIQRNGVVVGACMDGFLFGACCLVPEESVGDLVESDEIAVKNPENALHATKLPPTSYTSLSHTSSNPSSDTPFHSSSHSSSHTSSSNTYPSHTSSSHTSPPHKYQTHTYPPHTNPPHTSNDVTSDGVSQITNSLYNAPVLPTAQDNTMIQFDKDADQFTTAGVTHPSAPDTLLVPSNGQSEINPSDFTPAVAEERKTTLDIEDTTKPYRPDAPIIQISISNGPTQKPNKKPIFYPKPSRPSDNDKYVLVPTIIHNSPPNKTHYEFDSIVNIIQMLNESSTSKYGSGTGGTYSYTISPTKKPPSTSYVFSLTPTRRPGFDPNSTKKQPSASYIYSTTLPPKQSHTYPPKQTYNTNPPKQTYNTNPPKQGYNTNPPKQGYNTNPPKQGYETTTNQNHHKRKPTTQAQRITKPSKSGNKKPQSNTTPYIYPSSSVKPTHNYVYSSTFRPTKGPTKATYGNSPSAFPGGNTSKKPPSTSYVYSSTITKRPKPTSAINPIYSVTPTPSIYSSSPSIYSSSPSPPPTVIVLGPLPNEPSTPKPATYSVATEQPPRKPVTQITINNHITQNIFSTERPSPTVLITPKPSITGSPYPSIDYQTSAVEQETSADDLINFPPVRNPNLNMSGPIYDEDGELITTPGFIEDEVLDKKVASFVNKIVQSLQEPFQGLRDVVYNKNKTTTAAQSDSTTKKPTKTKQGTTKKPTSKPSSYSRPSGSTPSKVTTKKPAPPRRPTTTQASKKPTTTTKRTKPSKKVTTTTPSYIEEDEEDSDDSGTDFRNQCGVRPMVKSGRIVGGKGATFGEFPWQVLVRESTWLGLFTKNKCGGVLISNRYVITAAHCQPGFLASLVAVFGEFDISGDLESKRALSRNVKRVIVHRQYDPATFENDLALLELEHPVQFDSHIVPICLPRDGEDFTGRIATVTGWGRLKYGGGVPSVLQEVQVPIMENHVCQDMFRTAGHNKVIMESFLCAGYANGLKDSCEGDSGGPLVLQRPDGRYQLAGTVSHGIKCAAPYLPGVYMRTTYYKPWIESITGMN